MCWTVDCNIFSRRTTTLEGKPRRVRSSSNKNLRSTFSFGRILSARLWVEDSRVSLGWQEIAVDYFKSLNLPRIMSPEEFASPAVVAVIIIIYYIHPSARLSTEQVGEVIAKRFSANVCPFIILILDVIERSQGNLIFMPRVTSDRDDFCNESLAKKSPFLSVSRKSKRFWQFS